ncbi:hypothetical protein PGTUg99_029349 [Puccinia graminis f. sp. tritici]|uniref:Hydrophobin n=2 Tax=Puccinia graminis f. sp. tritici TaxID=56615 RepID=E3K950_PUCGT|nr:uncharacterized protein PGTG_06642 [Puccinia graminis f. sp. tritici CRL 75-36-700-3]EFP80686.2 hypothetical protein PGTG_06642 [Puccinia graminis f. sp. tritici CRL 75-36-700-3]KAA1123908.1 hypothetical protein PGTUg99_029349 [Puccinia graminis f. sp. tritici]
MLSYYQLLHTYYVLMVAHSVAGQANPCVGLGSKVPFCVSKTDIGSRSSTAVSVCSAPVNTKTGLATCQGVNIIANPVDACCDPAIKEVNKSAGNAFKVPKSDFQKKYHCVF